MSEIDARTTRGIIDDIDARTTSGVIVRLKKIFILFGDKLSLISKTSNRNIAPIDQRNIVSKTLNRGTKIC